MRIDRFDHLSLPAAGDPDQAYRNARTRRIVARLAATRRHELTVRVVRRGEHEGLPRDDYVFDHGGRQGIRAAVLTPPGTGPWPAILVCPGRNAVLEQVTGVIPPDHPDRDVSVHLARAGYLTLTLDYGLAERQDAARPSGRDHAEVLDGGMRLYGGSLLGALVEDASAALDWLAAGPLVEAGRVGLFGHSLGAAVALHTALLGTDPLPVCAASHLGSYGVMIGRLRTWNSYAALPSILRYADLADLYAALAPAPLQIQYGDADSFLDPSDAAAAGKRVQDAYAAVGGEKPEVLKLAMGHGSGIAEAAGFFDRALATARTAAPGVPAARVGFDVPARAEIAETIDDALATGRLTLGPTGVRLEEMAAAHLGRGVAAVSSGSAALEIALRIVGVGGRTVLVPVNTFFATAASAIRAGARVDFVDMEPDGLGMDPDALRIALAEHDDVAAVMPVHIAGIVSPRLTEILTECDARGIPVVEDAAHALGSTAAGRPAGGFGRLATFSLYPTKVVTSGEGGLLTAAPADLDAAKRLRDHGKRSFEENLHGSLGSNWRMSELHAAVGATHLARLNEILAERKRLATWYDENLPEVPGLTPQAVPPDCESNYYKYVCHLPGGTDRAALKSRLRAEGVSLAGEVYDTLLSEQPFFAATFAGRRFVHAERFAARHVCLPLFPGMTTRQQERVVTALRAALP